MTQTTAGQDLTATLPERPKCRQHGYMTVRPATAQTKEQEFCGTWYDCPEYVGLRRCQSTVLLPSENLRRQLAAL